MLSSGKTILITRPVKENGIVLLNIKDFITKMEYLTRVETDVLEAIFKHDDRNNRLC